MNNLIDERIEQILKDRWIGHTRSKEILRAMEMLLKFPKSGRMQNILVVGEPNSGKTTIARRFLNNHQPYLSTIQEEGTGHPYEVLVRPVVMLQCPHIPHEKRLYYNVLDELNLPYRKTTKAEYLQQQVVAALIDMQIRVLILDEIHHILSGSPAKQREFLNLIKYLSNEAQISIVALGTNEATFALKSDRQLDTRFDKLVIPRWKYDEDYLRLLATLNKFLLLNEETRLTSPELSKKIFVMSNGVIGEVIKIIKLASIKAIESGTERITLKVLDSVSYISPFDNTPSTVN
ncbi:MAG: TniB family NTP-binding protein [bacterium]|nr:TniB family NTP-binding protein [bacterium]